MKAARRFLGMNCKKQVFLILLEIYLVYWVGTKQAGVFEYQQNSLLLNQLYSERFFFSLL